MTTAGPEVTVRALLTAAKTADRDAIFELLTPATRDALEASAKRATDLVGAAIRFNAKDLISIGSFDPTAAPTDITLLEQHGDRAIVEIVSPSGRARLDLLEIDGRWRVDLPHYADL
ncbi:MAG: hypothetical protein ABJE66_19090 [Deltaproteobacteria bacterium]